MTSDPFANFKSIQRENWALFLPLEAITIQPAGLLVEFAGVNAKQRVLDVGCGTGVAAVTAARRGAQVNGLDLSPVLLERAKENASIAQLEIDFREGDVENLPFNDSEFDCVLSQFGHMFAPRPEIALSEMLRVLKPGGTIAFSTWPPELYTGKMFALVSKYMPPPEGVAPPPQWGDPAIVRERLGSKVSNLLFSREVMSAPALSINHALHHYETNLAPVIKLKEKLQAEDKAALELFRKEFRELIGNYIKLNTLQQHFLMTRAIKN
jgi:SAM-dependent methyltransferase